MHTEETGVSRYLKQEQQTSATRADPTPDVLLGRIIYALESAGGPPRWSWLEPKKKELQGRELNPGLLRDRQEY